MVETVYIPAGQPSRPLLAPLAAIIAEWEGQPRLDERGVEEARQLFISMRPEIKQTSDLLTEDRTIEGPAGPMPIRLYRRASAEGPLPILLYFHGGGFVIGSIDTHDIVCRRFASRADLLVISLDYRLAPEHPFPAAPDDAYAALTAIAQSGSALGGDPGKIALSGDSAGGMLVLATALRARDASGPALAALLPFYPMTDLVEVGLWQSYQRYGTGDTGLSTRDMAWFIDAYAPDKERRGDPYASPVRADLSDLPPTLVVLAEHDVLRDEGLALVEGIAAAGGEVRLVDVSGVNHGFISSDLGLTEVAAVFDDAMPWLMERLSAAP